MILRPSYLYNGKYLYLPRWSFYWDEALHLLQNGALYACRHGQNKAWQMNLEIMFLENKISSLVIYISDQKKQPLTNFSNWLIFIKIDKILIKFCCYKIISVQCDCTFSFSEAVCTVTWFSWNGHNYCCRFHCACTESKKKQSLN